MQHTIALLPGDGIGPEIVQAAVDVLEAVAKKHRHTFAFQSYDIGGTAYDKTGHPLPEETVAGCKAADAVLLGAVGGPKWDTLPGHLRPEAALLGIRAALGLYANLRPAKIYPALKEACPLRTDIAAAGFDILIVRELTGGIYFGERGRGRGPGGEFAWDTEKYSWQEIGRIAEVAFRAAKSRKGKVTSIDKANVLESSRLWREVVHEMAALTPEIECVDMLVDNAAMQLVRNPSQFDVIVTSNMFGDILSDEASQITGSIGMLPSASLGDGTRGLYEPIHGSAPDIAGKGIANPLATILSAAMLLRHSLGLEAEAQTIENAVEAVLAQGVRTGDIAVPGETAVTCAEMTAAVCAAIA
ncbi:MAG: 3-isopropylmalate dehydrogenase [Oscillospiraceae bacterium]|nr:3-isopropylmalate dehydrogenase [Oscillospiraceae bacterium]